MYDVSATTSFVGRARALFRRRPDLKAGFAEALDLVRRDPFDAGLAPAPLEGEFSGGVPFRVRYRRRIDLTVAVGPTEVVLLDVAAVDGESA